MKEFTSINDVLDFAIENEQGAVDFYKKLAEEARNEEMKSIFEQFAREEIGHKARLIKIREQGNFEVSKEVIADLRVSDYIANVDPYPGMSYQDALRVAMSREKSAFKLYSKLSAGAQNDEMKALFQSLAQEESKHKLRFELEYDDFVMREN
ncbi:MAG: ferritin family protein [Bacteroidota bacterium]